MKIENAKIYQLEANDALRALNSSPNGLSDIDVKNRLSEYGLNKLEKKKKTTPLKIFLNQFNNFLIWILVAAVILSFAIGFITKKPEDYIDAIVILAIVIINALLGFFQEYKAEKAMEALQKLSALKAKVVRNGKKEIISSEELVPGDIILLETGDKVPADARIIEIFNLHTDESVLTGESTSVTKELGKIVKEAAVAERKNLVYSGTIITRGKCTAAVYATGMATEFGKIATMVQSVEDKETPLQKKLAKVGHNLGIFMIAVSAAVFVLGIFRGTEILTMLLIAVSLAVAAVPEGLPAVVTITLAIGLTIMARSNALVRKLPAVETLGSTTVICSDKTGTLTKNEMTVKEIFVGEKKINVTGSGYSSSGEFLPDENLIAAEKEYLRLLQKASVLCNNAELVEDNKAGIFGDPTEGALLVAAKKGGFTKKMLSAEYKRVYEIEFTSERKMMSTINKSKSGNLFVFAKGAPEEILKKCDFVFYEGNVRRLSPQLKKHILWHTESMAERALRVLGFAHKELKSAKYDEKNIESGLIFIGLAGMIDPPREEVIDAIKLCKSAGIRSVMITGDHKITAEAIAKELGLSDGIVKALTGDELSKMSDSQLEKEVETVNVYARVAPEHKVRILHALKKNGEIVAMTGDGVNDAPALKKADIGIAMGITGTDVAKEAADMVLQDDNFATIVKAVEHGRGIYDNIKKFLAFLLSGNIGEILIIGLAMLIGFTDPATGKFVLPLLASQLLWINMLTDGLPALALSVEPIDSDMMKRKPRNPKESIFTGVRAYIVEYSIIMFLGTIALFYWALQTSGVPKAITVAFTSVVFFELFQAFSCRSLVKPVIKLNFFANKYLLLAVAISALAQLSLIYIPALQKMFHTVALGLFDWVAILLIASTGFIYLELYKVFKY